MKHRHFYPLQAKRPGRSAFREGLHNNLDKTTGLQILDLMRLHIGVLAIAGPVKPLPQHPPHQQTKKSAAPAAAAIAVHLKKVRQPRHAGNDPCRNFCREQEDELGHQPNVGDGERSISIDVHGKEKPPAVVNVHHMLSGQVGKLSGSHFGTPVQCRGKTILRVT